MNDLQIGYAEETINPELGISITGYYVPRFAKGFLSDLKAIALAVKSGNDTAMIISLDLCEPFSHVIDKIRVAVKEKTLDLSAVNAPAPGEYALESIGHGLELRVDAAFRDVAHAPALKLAVGEIFF